MSAEATESKFFLENKLKSINSTLNSQEQWTVDIKYFLQANHAVERLQTDLQEGILLKARMHRSQ